MGVLKEHQVCRESMMKRKRKHQKILVMTAIHQVALPHLHPHHLEKERQNHLRLLHGKKFQKEKPRHLHRQDKPQKKEDDLHHLLDPHPGGIVEILGIGPVILETLAIPEMPEILVIVEILVIDQGIKSSLCKRKRGRRIKVEKLA